MNKTAAIIANPAAIEDAKRALHARLCACRGDLDVHVESAR